jgi:hypothetical protein
MKDHDPLKANLCRFTQYNQVYFREIKRPKSVLIARGHIPLDLPDIICRMRIERGDQR